MKKSTKSLRPAMPQAIKPMLCTLVDKPPMPSHYLFEVKWDGYRIIAYVNKGKVRLQSRGGKDYTAKYPLVVESLQQINHDVIIDGEVVVFNQEEKQTLAPCRITTASVRQ